MLRKLTAVLLVAVFALPSATALAQEGKWELAGTVGYKFGGGFDTTYDLTDLRVNLKSGVNYGFGIGYNFNRQFMFEVAWNQQSSAANVSSGSGNVDEFTAFDMKINQIHGNFIFHGGGNSQTRPYFLLGLGATTFRPDGDLTSTTRFSFALGGGVKYWASDSFGLKLQGRWTPTYINSSPGGVWCDPFYCWQTVNNQYAGQFDITGSLMVRF